MEQEQDYISFFEAKSAVTKTLAMTPTDEEFWMWCFAGKNYGGIDAYDLSHHQASIVHYAAFGFPTHTNESGYDESRLCYLIRYLRNWRFLLIDIQQFNPQHRYITGKQVLSRWTEMLNDARDAQERIHDYSLSSPGDWVLDGLSRPFLYNQFPGVNDDNWSPIEQGVFLLKDVLEIEAYDHIEMPLPETNLVPYAEHGLYVGDKEAKPWLVSNPNDPKPEQPWYIPARYFARQLIEGDAALLTKRKLLALKVAQSLCGVRIKKRGGKKDFDPSTILKALNNINFS